MAEQPRGAGCGACPIFFGVDFETEKRRNNVDLKVYYQKIRDNEANIAEPFPIVVSLETSDGGKPGRLAEVPRAVAAKLMADGVVRLATKDEADAYRADQAKARQEAEDLAAAQRMELKIISAEDYSRLQSPKGKA
jgi:hypothetical protein